MYAKKEDNESRGKRRKSLASFISLGLQKSKEQEIFTILCLSSQNALNEPGK